MSPWPNWIMTVLKEAIYRRRSRRLRDEILCVRCGWRKPATEAWASEQTANPEQLEGVPCHMALVTDALLQAQGGLSARTQHVRCIVRLERLWIPPSFYGTVRSSEHADTCSEPSGQQPTRRLKFRHVTVTGQSQSVALLTTLTGGASHPFAAGHGSLMEVSTDLAQSHTRPWSPWRQSNHGAAWSNALASSYCGCPCPLSSSRQTLNIPRRTITRRCSQRTSATWRTTTQAGQ